MGALELKLGKLRGMIRDCESAVVAFSGGVDSSVLAALASRELGQRVVAVTLKSKTLPASELECARKIASVIGIRHVIIEHSELSDKAFVNNTRNRCYHCKKSLSTRLKTFAEKNGFKRVLEGTNAGELEGHRPGFRALKAAGVISPLAAAGLSKEDVRLIARRLRLPNFDKPSMACLSSRVPYGTLITKSLLERIEAAEYYIRRIGVGQVRVRCYGKTAVIEVLPKDFAILAKRHSSVERRIKELGFNRVALDLGGYRTGSMN
ncbi:MAG: ATP-dependent sacrificial sulfur transferase LarE [Candidatus Altiarchaeota archaeon]|nr:ATP-dependent sacrificial sulfur transferase LarE [Candidatus Altiarchaeota archaeon]